MSLTRIGSIGINTGIKFSGLTTITTLNSSIDTLSIGGPVSIAGTLTYEDVTNIDSVGLITARNGIVVGSGITLSKDGDVFFTGIATGNGSGLTALNASNISSGTVPSARLGSGTASSSTFLAGDSTFKTVTGTTINNNADNRVITGSGTANTLEGEANLTYNGTLLTASGSNEADLLHLTTGNSAGNTFASIRGDNEAGIRIRGGGSERGGEIELGGGLRNSDPAVIKFSTNTGNSFSERVRITSTGNVEIDSFNSPSTRTLSLRTGYLANANGGVGLAAKDHSGAAADGLGVYGTDGVSIHTANAGTVSERARIDSSGRLLVGHTSPTSVGVGAAYNHPLQVIGNSYDTSGIVAARYSDSTGGAQLHLVKSRNATKGSQTIVQVNDTLGFIRWYGSDGTDTTNAAATISAEVDATPASDKIPGRLSFLTTETLTYPIERLRINSNGKFWFTGADLNGNVSFPSSSSGARLQIGAHTFQGSDAVYDNNRLGMQINGNLSATIMLADVYNNNSYPGYGYVMVQGPSTSDYVTYAMSPDGPAKGNNLNFHIGEEVTNIHSGANTRQVWFNASGNAYKRDNSPNWATTSDERLKKNIVDNNKGLAEINQLRVTSFEYRKEEEIDMSQFPLASIPRDVVIEGEEGPHTGVIAQEIESIFPECVRTSNKGAKTVDADAITWALVNAIKELSAKNDALEAEIAALKG